MSDTEVVFLTRMFWSLVGFPLLIVINSAGAWVAWEMCEAIAALQGQEEVK